VGITSMNYQTTRSRNFYCCWLNSNPMQKRLAVARSQPGIEDWFASLSGYAESSSEGFEPSVVFTHAEVNPADQLPTVRLSGRSQSLLKQPFSRTKGPLRRTDVNLKQVAERSLVDR
jgi:hypothetical protein